MVVGAVNIVNGNCGLSVSLLVACCGERRGHIFFRTEITMTAAVPLTVCKTPKFMEMCPHDEVCNNATCADTW